MYVCCLKDWLGDLHVVWALVFSVLSGMEVAAKDILEGMYRK